jgi:hypothetical protein
MIQTTTRLRRGVRLRRGASVWIYAILAVGGFAAALLLVIFRH